MDAHWGDACDVSDEAQVQRFRDDLLQRHAADHVDLVFSNRSFRGGESHDALVAVVALS